MDSGLKQGKLVQIKQTNIQHMIKEKHDGYSTLQCNNQQWYFQ